MSGDSDVVFMMTGSPMTDDIETAYECRRIHGTFIGIRYYTLSATSSLPTLAQLFYGLSAAEKTLLCKAPHLSFTPSFH